MKKIVVVLLTCMLAYGCMNRTSYNAVQPPKSLKFINPAHNAPAAAEANEGQELHPLIFVSILLN
jgi:hypothetical protein